MPDVTGLAEADAIAALVNAGLSPGTRTETNDAPVTAGIVISTDPAAGSIVAPGAEVAFTVSSGAELTPAASLAAGELVTVPDVTGLAEADAIAALVNAGLSPGTRTETNDAPVTAGIVISTDPAAG